MRMKSKTLNLNAMPCKVATLAYSSNCILFLWTGTFA